MGNRRPVRARRGVRVTGLVAAGLVLGCVLAGTVLAAAWVSLSASRLDVTTKVIRNPNPPYQRYYFDHDIVVEPYHDAVRTGYRVRPRAGQETTTINTSDGECLRNPVVNDVVCSRLSFVRPYWIWIDLRNSGDDDRVAIREHQPESQLPDVESECSLGTTHAETSVDVYLGRGDDRFEVVGQTVCERSGDRVGYPYGIEVEQTYVDGGTGNDELDGSGGADTLVGGEGDDDLEPGPGDDVVMGGPGDDTFFLSEEEAGPDPYYLGSDRVVGGEGFDTVSYTGRTRAHPVYVSLDDNENDGEAGERDYIREVEKVLGGSGNDVLQGTVWDEQLWGRDGADRLEGGSGDDGLYGGDGPDTLLGGFGRDDLSGGPGSDVIEARDLVADAVSCGTGGDTVESDRAELDLRDTGYADCETAVRVDPGFGVPARVTNQTVRPSAAGTATFTVECLSSAKFPCAGELKIRDPAAAATAGPLAKVGYSLAKRQTTTLQVTLASWPATVKAVTTDTVTSSGTKRETIRLLPVAGA